MMHHFLSLTVIKVDQDHDRPVSSDPEQMGGLVGALAKALASRRTGVNISGETGQSFSHAGMHFLKLFIIISLRTVLIT